MTWGKVIFFFDIQFYNLPYQIICTFPLMTYHLIIILYTEDLRGAILSDRIFFILPSSFIIMALEYVLISSNINLCLILSPN